MRILSAIVLLTWFCLPFGFAQQAKMYALIEGKVSFRSEAPLEIIKASSSQVRGVINPSNHKFAFSIPIQSFFGFNSPLQQEHFNENYMESTKFPNATFTGKIIEKIDFDEEGEYIVRAKGRFNIHGIKNERIIKSRISIKNQQVIISAVFSILLKEHNIIIPKIVHQKIAKEILVSIDAVFELK